MAVPELTPLTTPNEIFHYPLPTVRHFHKQIHIQLEEKNARLRTLVGGSYRQLMGTAGTIVRMRTEIGEAEDLLAKVGDRCGRSQVGKMVGGLDTMGQRYGDGGYEDEDSEFGRRARAKVLESCVVVVGRLLSRKSDVFGENSATGLKLVTAAKVLVLSRLLLKSLSVDQADGTKEKEGLYTLEVEELRRRLEGLRRRLKRAVERRLERIDVDDGRGGLLQALCAYSLVTSSGARDVMRHFLQVRGEAIALIFGDDTDREQRVDEEDGERGLIKTIGLYTKTLLDVQTLVPKRLADALAEQKAKPLLRNADVRALEGLRIDVSERWFGDVISNFTLYNRHDDLDGPSARDMLRGWAKKSSEVLLQGFKQTIERVMDFKKVVELRTKTFEIWISEGGKAKGFSSEMLLDGLRDVVNTHLVELLGSRVGKLHIVGTEVERTLEGWSTGTSDQKSDLWDPQMLSLGISNGANEFKLAILDRIHGRIDAVSRITHSYRTWRRLIEEVTDVIEQLKKQRWDDDIEDIEDEDNLENRQDLLSTQDPGMLREHLETCLTDAFKNLHSKLQAIISAHGDDTNKTGYAIFILRVLREIRAGLPDLDVLKLFGLSIIPGLHDTLVKSTTDQPIKLLAKSFHRKKVIGKLLWEGEPVLPVQPSPFIFKFVHSLNLTMAATGSDLWSPTALGVLKRYLRAEIGKSWKQAILERDQERRDPNGAAGEKNSVLEEREEAVTNGHAVASILIKKDTDTEHDISMQALFDVLVLDSFLKVSTISEDDPLNSLEQILETRLKIASSETRRLQHASVEYWKRTNLMFGLLA